MQLVSQLEAQALMTEPGPSSPQGSAGGPGTPQNISQPSRDFLRADVTPLEDMTPLNVNPTSVIISQSFPFCSPSGCYELRVLSDSRRMPCMRPGFGWLQLLAGLEI